MIESISAIEISFHAQQAGGVTARRRYGLDGILSIDQGHANGSSSRYHTLNTCFNKE